MRSPDEVIFLLDIDNTLVDNDRVQDDLLRYLEREFGAASTERHAASCQRSLISATRGRTSRNNAYFNFNFGKETDYGSSTEPGRKSWS